MSYHAIVLGLGAMGSAAACQLASRCSSTGKKILGLDRFHPPHTFGSSHGETRVIRQAYFEHPDYVPLLKTCYDRWHRLEHDYGDTLLQQTGALMIGPENSDVVAGSLRAAREHGLPHQLLDAAELRRRYPVLRPPAGTMALYEEVAGALAPESCITAHLEAAAQAGAELHFSERVESWTADPGRDGVTVRTSAGTYQAEHLVLAAGAWMPDLLYSAGSTEESRLQADRKVLLWLEPEGGERGFMPHEFPIWVWEPEGEYAFYGFPALDGRGGGVKAGLHTNRDDCHADELDRDVHGEDAEALYKLLRQFIPRLDGEILHSTVCMYTHTPDDHFLLGPHPDHAQVTVAGGFSGHGFKFSVLVGEIVADLVLEGKTTHPIGLFAPDRFR